MTSMAIITAGMVGVVQVFLATGVFISLARPERAPPVLAELPIAWRLLGLAAWSVVCGAVFQWARL